jgi:hypothetical protein
MISLDHVGVVGHSIDVMRRSWLEAGFFVTEPEELMALESGSGKRVSLGQHSCHVILELGYIELTAVDRPNPAHHLWPWIKPTDSLGIIALGAADIDSVHRRLLAANVPLGEPAQASRPIHYGARRGDALFTWFALGAASTPEALVCFVRNERPELIYQPEVQVHPNGAQALAGVILVADVPQAAVERYETYSGAPAEVVSTGLWRCPLQAGSIWIGTPAALAARFGAGITRAASEVPRSVGFIVACRAGADSTKREQVFWFA